MARLFTSASSEYLEAPTAAISSLTIAGFTLACWFRQDDSTTETLLSIANNAAADQYWILGVTSARKVRAAGKGSGDASEFDVDTSNAFTANQWHHAAATFKSAAGATLQAFADGVGVASGASARGTVTPNVTSIGRLSKSTPANYFGGQIAHAAIWSAVLTNDEIRRVAGGESPLRIRPEALAVYLPIGQTDEAYRGFVFAKTGTLPRPTPETLVRPSKARRVSRLVSGPILYLQSLSASVTQTPTSPRLISKVLS